MINALKYKIFNNLYLIYFFLFFFLPAKECVSQIQSTFIQSHINLDGLLNESAWENAEPVTDFTQRELIEGAPATEKTAVRVVYDEENLYIGVICFDSEPDKIIHKELKLDGGIKSDDRIDIAIDTYHDKRMGYFFVVNPNGARLDATFLSSSRVGNGENPINIEWDGIWDAKARIMDYGWSCEIVIPFKTLRFPATDTQIWGINFMRAIRRKNEEVLWRGWERNDGIFKLSKAGTLLISKPLESSRQLDVKPYILSGAEKNLNRNLDDTFKYGLDLKFGITSNTTLALTTKTDFAQIESDKEIINLTRFDISYPEKRDFFLEGADLFEFKQGMMNIFYTRRIGLTPERKGLPILGGAKLVQKTGSYRMGVMTIQTEEGHDYPSANYTVARVKKDVFEQSYIGFMGTSILDADGHDNQVYGTDFILRTDTFLGNKNFEIQGYLTGSVTDGKAHESMAGRLFFNYPNDLISTFILYHAFGNKFNPEMGFISRDPGIQQYMFIFNYTPRPSIPFVKKLNFQPIYFNYYANTKNKLISRTVSTQPFGLISDTDDELGFTIQNEYDYIEEIFPIFDDVIIPRGGYEWWNYEINFESSKSRTVSFEIDTQWGDFYNGKRDGLNVECTFKTSRYYALSADVRYNNISIGNRHFDTKEYGSRLAVDLSTHLSSSTFVQWNNQTKELNVNFRIRYIPKIGSDVYIVYNHLMDEDDEFRTLQNAGMFKVDYTYRF